MQTIILYIDPSSGGLIVQGLIAGTLGIIMFAKNIKYKIQSLFGGKRPTQSSDNEQN
jgi:phosphatidylserine decarboxylase